MIASSIGNEGDRWTVEDCGGSSSPMRTPLDDISFSTTSAWAPNGDEGSEVSSISDLEDEENDGIVRSNPAAKVVDAVPRSIFSRYWKDDLRRDNPAASSARHCSESNAQIAVLRSKIPPDQNAYQVFRIHRSRAQEQQSEEDSSLNTYERTLLAHEHQPSPPLPCSPPVSSLPPSPFESRPLWMSFFSGNDYCSEPHLLSAFGSNQTRATRSDTALIQTPKKSCLRKGRFAQTNPGKAANPCNNDDGPYTKSPSSASKVCFQPKIQVHVFQPPVEQWSPSGWSSFFG